MAGQLRVSTNANHIRLASWRSDVRWGWILAVALGTLLGLLVAAWLGETGEPDQFGLGVAVTGHRSEP